MTWRGRLRLQFADEDEMDCFLIVCQRERWPIVVSEQSIAVEGVETVEGVLL